MAVFTDALLVALLCIFPALIYGDACVEPTVESKVYTSNDAILSSDTVFIIQFKLTCQDGRNDVNLYAHFNGLSLPVTKSEGGTYQVSFSGSHKQLPSGSYTVQLFDEEGYATLRKAQRLGESPSTVTSLYNIDFRHYGVWTGPVVQSELVAIALATVVWYLAYSTRAKLQS